MKKFFKKLLKLFFYLLFIAFAIFLIVAGFQLNKMTKKSYVFDVTLDSIKNKSYEFIKIENPYNFGDEFSSKSNIKLNFQSEEYEKKSLSDPEYYKKVKLLNNLSRMDINTSISQSKKDGKLLLSLDEKIGEEEIISGKYYVDNYTKYYFVNSILSNYVNDGNNNYFELLDDKHTTNDNIEYLYNKIFDSIKNSIKEEDLESFDTEINLGDERTKVGQVSLEINNKYVKKLLKNTLNDIKKDKKANQIIESLYPQFKDFKFDSNKDYLKENESYTINIYLRKLLYQPVKYEITHLEEDSQEILTYEGSLESGVIYYTKNNELKYKGECESTPKKLEIIIHDTNGTDVGTIKLEKTTNSVSFNTTLDLENDNYNISFQTIYKNFEKNKSYNKEDNLTYKITHNMVTKMYGNVIINTEVTKASKIKEDIDNAILESTLGNDTKNRIDNLYNSIKERLER